MDSLIALLNKTPTPFHLVEEACRYLVSNGFRQLKEQERWQLESGGRYFVVRGAATVCAFTVPEGGAARFHVAAAHSDSPCFKLKPQPQWRIDNMLMLGCEVYGSPLYSSWLNRDLKVAGLIFYRDGEGAQKKALVDLERYPLTIPQLAIHLDRDVNKSGLMLNPQDHLAALAALANNSQGDNPFLEVLKEEMPDLVQLLGHDLFLVPLEQARSLGFNSEFIASWRIDNVASVSAILFAMVKAPIHQNNVNILFIWDHEEIGSSTCRGASSPFAAQIMERITIALGYSREDYFRLISSSLALSLDMAHAMHPNYSEKHEPHHRFLLGDGVVVKHSASQRYATDASTASQVVSLCSELGLKVQHMVNRNDIPSGSTIGPLHAAATGMSTVDIGIPMLSMHACRELMAYSDYEAMEQLVKQFYTSLKWGCRV